jgi:hypothetical protein
MHARSELIAAEVAEIKRFARVAEIKRRALDLTAPIAISDDNQPVLNSSDVCRWLVANEEPILPTAKAAIGLSRMPRRARPILVFPAKYARLLQSCMCVRAR